MVEKVRINLSVDEGIPELMEKLAGGRNKMGDFLSKLIRTQIADETTATEIQTMDSESLRLMVQGLAGRVKVVEGELIRTQSQISAMIAGWQR